MSLMDAWKSVYHGLATRALLGGIVPVSVREAATRVRHALARNMPPLTMDIEALETEIERKEKQR